MSKKPKVLSGNQTEEVTSARTKLDGVLQHLMDKKDDAVPSTSNSEPDDLELDDATSTSPAASPSKRHSRSPRKRKRARDMNASGNMLEMGQYHHTYVMKLFDRSVDLAQFEDNFPLYPICRAWMRNQPHNRNLGPRERSPTPDPDESYDEFDDSEEMEDLVYHLPPPVPIKRDPDQDQDPRIPEPLLPPEDPVGILPDPSIAPAPEQLLLNHMLHWKEVRQSWKSASRHNEALYVDSLNILKEMFDKQCKE